MTLPVSVSRRRRSSSVKLRSTLSRPEIENSPTQPDSPWSGATTPFSMPRERKYWRSARSWTRCVSTGPVRPPASVRRLSASGSSIGSSIRRSPSRLSEERAERFGSAEKSTRSTAPTRNAEAVRASSASSSGTISDERDSVRVAS